MPAHMYVCVCVSMYVCMHEACVCVRVCTVLYCTVLMCVQM